MTINVGDRVKVVQSNTLTTWKGAIGTVTKIRQGENFTHLVAFDEKVNTVSHVYFNPRELEVIAPTSVDEKFYEVRANGKDYFIRRYPTEAEAIAYATAADAHNPSSPGYRVYKITSELIEEISD